MAFTIGVVMTDGSISKLDAENYLFLLPCIVCLYCSLGMFHDGGFGVCRFEDGYIMASSVSLARRLWS